ncbi:type II secretion system F family protein [Deferrisoma palaeochoriense]
MGEFVYRAYTAEGAVREGRIEAPDEAEAARLLRGRGLRVVSLDADRGRQGAKRAGRRSARVGTQDTLEFVSRLRVLVESGVRPDRALEAVATSLGRGAMGPVAEDVAHRVRGGAGIAEALSAHPEAFDAAVLAAVSVGEASGRLGPALRKLEEELTLRRRLRQRVGQALVYPLAVCAVSVATVGFLTLYVVPRFAALAPGEAGGGLSWLLAAEGFLRRYGWAMAAAAGAAAFAIGRALRNKRVREGGLELVARLPRLGRVVSTATAFRVASSLSLLLGAGLRVDEALRVVGELLPTARMRAAAATVRQGVARGERLSRGLVAVRLLDPAWEGVVEVGEEAGRLAETFARIAEETQQQLEDSLVKATGLIEPVLITVVGLIVGGVAVALVSGILGMTDVAF